MVGEWKVDASVHRDYDVRVVSELFDPANPALLTNAPVPGRRFVVADSGVPAAFIGQLENYFLAHQIEARVLRVQGGEKAKSMEEVVSLIRSFEDFRLDRRNEPVLIVGGGAVLDSAGFAASIYRRGVPFVKIPTTVLAQIDAAIGVKNAINLGEAKNLIGTFHAPEEVLLSAEFFRDLPEREVMSGLGELFKLGTACDEVLFDWLERDIGDAVDSIRRHHRHGELLVRSIAVMLQELEPDLHEERLARSVDFGHTFSLAIEMQSGQQEIRHGEAVTGDILLSTAISLNRGLIGADQADRIFALGRKLLSLARLHMPTSRALWQSVNERKRHRGGSQRIPLPQKIGQCVFVEDLSISEIVDALGRDTDGTWPWSQII